MNHSIRAVVFLVLVSIIWAFSFGLIKTFLSGVDAAVLAFCRLVLALLLFLPWLRPRRLPIRESTFLVFLGALQYGLMYLLLFQAFRYLQAYEVVLFTLLTPLYIDLLDDARHRRFRTRSLVAVLLAIAGAWIIKYRAPQSEFWWIGFFIMQGANLCFGSGQLIYRYFRQSRAHLRDREIFGWLFLGGALLASVATFVSSDWSDLIDLSWGQIAVVAYLGLVASGLGFFLWNYGAVHIRSTTLLAVFNNLSIPLGVAVSLIVFRESADLSRLLLGGFLMLASLRIAALASYPSRTSTQNATRQTPDKTRPAPGTPGISS